MTLARSASVKTLLVLSTSFPRWQGDHAGNFVAGLCRALESKDLSSIVIAPEDKEARDYNPLIKGRVHRFAYLPKSLQTLAYGGGIPENVGSSALHLLKAPFFLRGFWKMAEQKARGADLIFSNWLFPGGYFGAKLRKKTGKPHVCVEHSGGLHLLRQMPGGKRILGNILRNTDAVVCVSQHLKMLLEEFAGEGSPLPSIHVIPMGIHTREFSLPPRNFAEKKLQLLYLGRLAPIKGVEYLLNACAKIDNLSLVIAGDGPQKPALESLAATFKLDCHFTGLVGPEERKNLFATSHLLVLPSVTLKSGRAEGFPTVLMEAMASGLPIIASDSGGIREMIDDAKHGMLVPEKDSGALAKAIQHLKENPARLASMSEANRVKAATWDWMLIAEEFDKLIRKYPNA